MDREQAQKELAGRLTNPNLIKHSYAVEAIMRELAELLEEDVEQWGMAGLLHDIDYDSTATDPSKHSIVGARILENLEVDSTIVYAVKAHNAFHGIERKRKIDKALYAADPISGLITAGALITSSKKLTDIQPEFVMKRFYEKSFAKGANRQQIEECKEIGLSLEQFVEIALNAMKKIADDLGL